MCRDFAPEFAPELISRPSDLVNRFGLLSAFTSVNVSSLCDPPVLFDRALSQPVLSGSSCREFVPGVRAGSYTRHSRGSGFV